MRRLITALFLLLSMSLPGWARETLTVYTYDSFVSEWGPGAKVKEAFEKTCGCTLEWVGLGDGVALLNRLKLEGANSKADLVLGLDTSLTAEAAATGLFQQHGLDKSLARLPAAWADDYFMPYDYAPFAVIYDTEKMKQPPKSLDELVNGDPAQKIILQDPRASTPGLGFLLWMKSVYGDKAGEAWAKLKPRILTVAPGWSEAYGLFTKGEAPMVLSYTTSPAYHMIAENTARYQAASFSEGHYAQIEVAGITAASKQPELARKFLAFMMSPAFQDLIPTTNWMLPAGETKEPLPEAFGKLVQPTRLLQFTPEEVAANRRAWIEEWLSATTR
jgi:thiamine transport system substrate-binding protein